MTLLLYAADGYMYLHITALLQHSAYLHLQNCVNLYNGIFPIMYYLMCPNFRDGEQWLEQPTASLLQYQLSNCKC